MKWRKAILFFVVCLVLFSCEQRVIKKSDKPKLDSVVWIFDTSTITDSLKDFTDNYMIVDSADLNFNGNLLGELRQSHDTIRIINISYLVTGDSSLRQESLVFEGIIEKHTNDTLIFKRLRGYFPLKHQATTIRYDKSDRFIFFNEELLKKPNQKIQELSFSNSNCFGKCPAMACEIDSSGKINFLGGTFSGKTGYFTGTVSQDYFRKLNSVVSYIHFKNDTSAFPLPTDAPSNEISISTNNKNFYFTGYGFDYPNKLRELYVLLLHIPENSNLSPVRDTPDFKTRLHYPPSILKTVVRFTPPKSNNE
jgi:hypothetical protein